MNDNPFASLELEAADKNSVHTGRLKFVEQSGRYRVGQPTRPEITHDNGHLGRFPVHPPTLEDKAALTYWKNKLVAGEAFCRGFTGKHLAHHIPQCGEDITDALAAYRHFLYGNGADRFINYERFIIFDDIGKQLIPKILTDFQTHVEILAHDRMQLSVTSEVYKIGDDGFLHMPLTVNWKRTLGGHNVWVSADIKISVDSDLKIAYHADITFHMEDRYNFNVGQRDTSTGIPDEENGRFEITGLAKQYNTYAIVRRQLKWKKGERGYDFINHERPYYELAGGPMELPTSIEGEEVPLSTREPAFRKMTVNF